MSQRTETLPVEVDHPAFMIMPGINPMAVESIAEGDFHDPSRQYSYVVRPNRSFGVSPPVCVSATIGLVGNRPTYVERKMMLRTGSDHGLFGSVVIRHDGAYTEIGFKPEDGKVIFHNFETHTNYFLHEGSLVMENSVGVRQLVGDNAQFYDGKRRMSVGIDTSGIAVKISGQDFANISFDQSGVSIAVGNFQNPHTFLEELYFFEK